MNVKRLNQLLILNAVAFATAVGADNAPLDLKGILQYGLTHAPETKRQDALVEVANLGVDNRFAAFLPSLDLSSRYGIDRSLPNSGENPQVSALDITLSEKIYDNGESIVRYDRSKAEQTVADLSRKQSRDRYILETIQAYYAYCQANALLKIETEQAEIIKKQLTNAENQYHNGSKTKKDFLRFRTQSEKSLSALSNAQASLEIAKRKLSIHIGATDTSVAFLSEQAKPLDTKSPTFDLRIENTVLYRIQTLEEQIARFDTELVRKKHRPELFLETQASYNASQFLGTGDPLYEKDRVNWTAMLSLKYNLWDNGTRRRDISIALAGEAVAQAERTQRLQDASLEIETQKIKMQQSQENFERALRLLESEKETYQLFEQDYYQGRASYLEFIERLDSVLSARQNVERSYFTLLETRAASHFYQGDIYETFITQ